MTFKGGERKALERAAIAGDSPLREAFLGGGVILSSA